MNTRASVIGLILCVALPSMATDLRIELDPEHSEIGFRLQATLHSVRGTAATSRGSLLVDTRTGLCDGELTVDARSADTGNKKRDKKMHRRVLLSADHPDILLRAQRLDGELARAGTSEVTLIGQLEILGRAHDVAIPLHVDIDGEDFTAYAEFEVPYVEWGLEDPSTFILRVAKTVEITVTARGSIVSSG